MVRSGTGKVTGMYPNMLPVGGQNVQKRGFRTRDDILDAAVTVFLRERPADVTTRLIAAEAERSVGAIYQYFHDQGDIVDFLAARHLEHLRASLQAIVIADDVARNAGEIIEQLVDMFVMGCGRDPRLARVVAEHTPRLPQVWDFDEKLAGAASGTVRADPTTAVEAPRACRLMVMTLGNLVWAAEDPDELGSDLKSMFRRYVFGGGLPLDGAG